MLTLSSDLYGISDSFWFVLGPAMSMGGLITIFGTDPQKREIYDRSGARGGDTESGFPTSSFDGAAFEGELSPEDLFNMLFGGGPGFASSPGDLSCRAHRMNV